MNIFDSANYPEGVPPVLYSGDFWAAKFAALTEIYPTADYTLRLILVQQDAAGAQFVFDGSVIDGVHAVTAGGDKSGDLVPDEYFWSAKITQTSTGDVVTADHGYVTVRAGLDSARDVRSHTLRVLQAIRATIEGTASAEQSSYSVAGRSLSRRSPEELLMLEQEYARRWEREKAALDREAGRAGNSRKTLIRLDA